MQGLYTVRRDSENGCSVQGCHKASRYLVSTRPRESVPVFNLLSPAEGSPTGRVDVRGITRPFFEERT